MADRTSWVTHSTTVAYENPWIRVREDEVTRPDGQPGIYGVVEVRSPAVFVVPVTAADQVVLVEVDRYALGTPSLEVPAGGADGPLLAGAQRELQEETGLAAESWADLGAVFSLNGVSDAPGRVFLARGLTPVGGEQAEAEGITTVRLASRSELLELIADGTITDNETLGALCKAFVALGWVRGEP